MLKLYNRPYARKDIGKKRKSREDFSSGQRMLEYFLSLLSSSIRNADVLLLNDYKDIGLAVNTGKTKYMEIGCH